MPTYAYNNTGRYVSAIDKARANKGFISITDIMQKLKKPKLKTKKAAKPSLEYLSSYDPLTKEHAEATVAVAGVDIGPQLAKQIEEALGANMAGVAQPIIT